MKITIVGAGHGGCAAAAVYAKKGHQVKLLKLGNTLHNDIFNKIRKTKTIRLKGILGDGEFLLTDVTKNIPSAISYADIILIFYVANYHQTVSEKITPYLKDHQIVYICPGYAGSIIFLSEMMKCQNKSKVIFVEGETLPFTSRIIDIGTVNISSQNYGHPIASIPNKRIKEATKTLSSILGKCIHRNNVLEVALHNPNLIMHTTGIIMNASKIETSEGNFAMYSDGFTPQIWKIVKRLDEEKMEVMEKIGSKRRTYFEEFLNRTYANPSKYSFEEGFKIYANSTVSLKTKSIQTRYITEDVPCGLGLLNSLGKHLKIPTPTCNSLIHLASIMTGTDYFKESRSVESLGFSNVSSLLKVING